ncbi:hypothetical protein [Christiangramia salexigens]|uniref:Sensor of ECF-type sigma factor n=1 Tax=Christiangramia salexigens TaxID=1913577 RepID=A0A1L3J3N8_9FLAO|nr:hypothetical protein [Christiangramia salexigens]APG59737.1 hypothetical protein LPB144_04600 [Christiangramia salexigens]
MKKALIISLLLLGFINPVMAQDTDRKENHERIKALKVAFFTQELKLTDKLSEKFWPIYNQYEEQRRKLHKREHIDLANVECITEDEADDLIKEFLAVESEEYKIKKQLFKDLKEIITAKDIIRIHKLEDEFHKKLIKEYRSKKERNDTNSNE